jgi:hypothetical protein
MAVATRPVEVTAAMPEELDQVELDAELIYDRLVNHAWQCRSCWPWRNQLWAVHRLCPVGAGLADRYALAEVRRGRGE